MRLVFIHGRDQQGQDPVGLRNAWIAAFDRGLAKAGLQRPAGLDIVLPFYGDELDLLTRNAGLPSTVDLGLRGGTAPERDLDMQRELLEEWKKAAGVTDAEVRDQMPENLPATRGPLNWEWVQAIARAIDQRTGWGEAAMERHTRDVQIYLTRRSVRTRIDQMVLDTMGPGPLVVVGHSLGSVVAYSVLTKYGRAGDVRGLVTVGSPLGMNVVKRALAPIAMPAGVPVWYNAYDDRDFVALVPLDAEHFAVTPAIVNRAEVENHTGNRHGIDGYLDDAVVAGWIRALVG